MAKRKNPTGYHISKDKGKADSDMAGKGPGPVRGKTFDQSKGAAHQGQAQPMSKVPWSKGKMDSKYGVEGEGDAM
jgi:hypothetical protein